VAAGRPCVAGAKRKGAGWRGPRPARLARQRRDLPGGSSVLAVSDLTAGSPIPGRCGDGHAPRRRHEQRLLPRASGREPRPRIRQQRLEPCRHGRDRRRRTCALARRLARRGGTSRHPRPRTLGRDIIRLRFRPQAGGTSPAPSASIRRLVLYDGSAVGTPSSSELEVGARPNVVAYLIDTLRADHLGCYGYERITSPPDRPLCKIRSSLHGCGLAEFVDATGDGVRPHGTDAAPAWSAHPGNGHQTGR